MKQIEKSFINVIDTFNTVSYLHAKRVACVSRSVVYFLGLCQIGSSSGLTDFKYKLCATDGQNILTVISCVSIQEIIHYLHIHNLNVQFDIYKLLK